VESREFFILNVNIQCIKLFLKMASEIDLLRQENARLMVENAELKTRVAKLKEDFKHPRKDSFSEKLANISDFVVTNKVVSVNSKLVVEGKDDGLFSG